MVALRELRLDGNAKLAPLPSWLPESCPALEVLSLEACGLRRFDPVIMRLAALKQLNLNSNKGLVLPRSLECVETGSLAIGGLEVLSLASLGLEDAALLCLEPLTCLRRLDLRGNELVSLPPFLDRLSRLHELQLDQNEKLITPPREILRHGLPAIREYLGALRAGKVTRTIARVMFVGWARAGKTKLNHALRGALSEWVDEETVGIDTRVWPPGWAGRAADGIEFRSWDFAGQEEYYSMHRIFLSERAIYLFLVDISEPLPDLAEDPGDARFVQELTATVRFWLNSLTKITKGALVRVVATKVDRLDGAAVKRRVQKLLERLQEEERRSCEDLRAHLGADDQGKAKAQEALANRPSLPQTVEEILLSSLPQPQVKRAQELETPEVEPVEEPELPPIRGSWGWGPSNRSRQGAQAGGGAISREERTPDVVEGRDGAQEKGSTYHTAGDLQTDGGGGDGAAAGGAQARDLREDGRVRERYLVRIREALLGLAKEKRFRIEFPQSYVNLMEAVEKKKAVGTAPHMDWGEFEREMLVPSGLVTERAAQTATQLLHDLGIVLWYDQTRGETYANGQLAQDPQDPQDPERGGGLEQRVFLDPQWVVDLLKPVLGHKLDAQFEQLPAEGQDAEASKRRLEMINQLDREGILRHELLDLIPGSQQSPGLQRSVLNLLERYGLAYPVEPYPGGRHFIPSRSKDRSPADLHPGLFPLTSLVELRGIRLTFSRASKGRPPPLPEGFAASVIVSLHSLLTRVFQTKPEQGALKVDGQWKHGTLFRGELEMVPASRMIISVVVDVPSEPNTLELLYTLRQAGTGADRPTDDNVRVIGEYFESFCSVGIARVVNAVSPNVDPILEILTLTTWASPDALPDARFPGYCWSTSKFVRNPRPKWMMGDKWILGPAQPAAIQDLPSLRPEESGVSVLVLKLPAGLAAISRSTFPKLKRLDIAGAAVRALPQNLASLAPRLTQLNAAFNSLELRAVEMCELPKQLEAVLLHGNSLRGTPANLFRLEKLTNLNLDSTHLSEFSLPARAPASPRPAPDLGPRLSESITSLYLNDNKLAELLSDISRLVNLTSLNLKANQLEQLPTSITSLQALKFLHLSSNRLTSLPEGIGALSGLEILNLARNCLSGLPTSIGGLQSLRELRLEEQKVAGLGARAAATGAVLAIEQGSAHKGLLSQRTPDRNVVLEVQTARVRASASLKEGEEVGPGLTQPASPPEWRLAEPKVAEPADTEAAAHRLGRKTWWARWVGGVWRSVGNLWVRDEKGESLPREKGAEEPADGASQKTGGFVLPERIVGVGLGKLELLSCFDAGVREVPLWVCRLPGLKELHLSGNEVRALPAGAPKGEPGLGLPALERLFMERNQLTVLPEWLARSSKCEVLSLAENDLDLLPAAIGHMASLQILELGCNERLRFPEPPVIERGVAAIQHACKTQGRSQVWVSRPLGPVVPAVILLVALAFAFVPRAAALPEDSLGRPLEGTAAMGALYLALGWVTILIIAGSVLLAMGNLWSRVIGQEESGLPRPSLETAPVVQQQDLVLRSDTGAIATAHVGPVIGRGTAGAPEAVAAQVPNGGTRVTGSARDQGVGPVAAIQNRPARNSVEAALRLPGSDQVVTSEIVLADLALLAGSTSALQGTPANSASGGGSSCVSTVGNVPAGGSADALLTASASALTGVYVSSEGSAKAVRRGAPAEEVGHKIKLQKAIRGIIREQLLHFYEPISCWPFGDPYAPIKPLEPGYPQAPNNPLPFTPEDSTDSSGHLVVSPEIVVYTNCEDKQFLTVKLTIVSDHRHLEAAIRPQAKPTHFGYYQEKISVSMVPTNRDVIENYVNWYEPKNTSAAVVNRDKLVEKARGREYNVDAQGGFPWGFKLGFARKGTKIEKTSTLDKGLTEPPLRICYKRNTAELAHAWDVKLNCLRLGSDDELVKYGGAEDLHDKKKRCLRVPNGGPTVEAYEGTFMGVWELQASAKAVAVDVLVKRYFRLALWDKKKVLPPLKWEPEYERSILISW